MSYLAFAWSCIKEAWRESISKANSWGALLGAAVIYGTAVVTGNSFSLAAGWHGTLEAALLSVGVAWVVIFLGRLLFWVPYQLFLGAEAKGNKLKNRITALEQRLRPGMELTFSEDDFGVEIEEDRLLRQVASVRAHNIGGVQLDDCQVQVRLSSDIEGFILSNKGTPFPICEPFYLRVGESRSVGFLSLVFDHPASPVRLRFFRQVVGHWREFPEPVTVPAVDFDAHLTCICANSQPATVRIEFRHHVDRWRIRSADHV